MLNVTRLLCGLPTPGDALRYGEAPRHRRSIPAPSGVHRRPIVVWNVTRRCNLLCVHCYTASTDHKAPNELTHDEARSVVGDLAGFGVPVILFSGGEPLLREDLFELMRQAASSGVQPVLSSNGTLLTEDAVSSLKDAGVDRVGISLDGMESTNDRFRGKSGAFLEALDGIRRCQAAGFRVSLRFTMTRHNVDELDDIFTMVVQEGIPRLCVYHLAYAGRGRRLLPNDLGAEQRRQAVGRIFQRTREINENGQELEVLTVDNHADGAYLLLWAREHLPERLPEIQRLLTRNGGNSAGKGIGCIDERGYVHPDQFWRTRSVGNVRERPFSEIWQDESVPLLRQLRARHSLLPQVCRECRFLPQCNGNLRARADAATGDPWGEDPACYLTDEERQQVGEGAGV
ncbi:MAG: radical SAM protein [Chloroflexi bacterium]|nr:radical SAM protein [Chloroflexota bacterium]